MTVSLKHQFTSNVADSPDATLVQPSNWNAEHTLTAGADALLGTVTAGAVVEITCTAAGRAILDDADAAAQRTTLAAAGTGVTNTFTASQIISVTDNSNAALRVTQLGTGNAILVEDSTNPDSTPFAVAADGSVLVGNTAAQSGGGVFQIGGGQTTNAAAYATQYSYANASRYTLARANAGVTSVSSGDRVGDFVFSGHDGTSFVRLAHIAGDVDGTPGTNDMPGRLVFATTADGASGPTERMRIRSDGNVGIGTTSPGSKLQVNGDVSALFFINPTTVSADYTVPSNYNAMSAGPITIDSGVTVTVSSGSTWTVV